MNNSAEPRVLVVDDETAICDILREYLENKGCRVAVAHNSEEALQSAETLRPEIVFLDIHMPGRNGLEVLADLKREFPLTKVYMLTGVKSMDLARRSLLMGAADFIQKPFNFTYLDRILEM